MNGGDSSTICGCLCRLMTIPSAKNIFLAFISCYDNMINVIVSFGDEETKDIYNGVNSKRARKRLDSVLWKKAQMKLDMLKRANRLDDLKVPPNNKLEKLQKKSSRKI